MKKLLSLCFIDDDPIYQYMIKRMISKDHQVSKMWNFLDGEEGINYFASHYMETENIPDIIFLDINMPIIDGWQFLEEFSVIKPKINKPVTIYMVTSSTDPEDIQQANNIKEVAGYLVKPFDSAKLKEILDNHEES